MENSNNFTPKMIGSPDTANFILIHGLYETLVSLLNPFRWEYENILSTKSEDYSSVTPECVLKLLNMNQLNMEIFLKKAYIQANGYLFPGLSIDKIIQNDLLELPDEYNILLEAKREIEKIIEKILNTAFLFPLSSLFSEQENAFILTEEFETTLNESLKSYTESELQNKVLDAIEIFCDSVNTLIELKVVKPQGNLWTNVGFDLALAIENNKGSSRPLIPSRKMFRRAPLNRFNENSGIMDIDRRRSSLVR